MGSNRFTFGDVIIDVAERRLTQRGRAVPVPPKTFDVLVELARRSGRLVTRRELLDAVWPGVFVEEGILTVHISTLRKALGDDRESARYIETVAKSGYRLLPKGGGPVASAPAGDHSPELHDLVGRARAHLLSAARPQIPLAIKAFQEAIALDPLYGPSHAGLALAYCAEAEFRLAPFHEAFGRARASALKALALDDSSSDARTALGAVMFLSEWDWIGAERSLQRALEMNPDHAQARLLYGRLLDAQGRLDDGLAMKLRALETDPFSPSVHLSISQSYWNQRRFDETIRWATKSLELDPLHGLAREFLAGAYWAMGDFDRHMAENLKHAANHGLPASALDGLRDAYAAGGRAGVIRLALEQASTMPEMQLALFHAELGDLDAALPYLERAIDARDPCLVDLAVAPQWDALRAHPRFNACVLRVSSSGFA
jgi:tetratricopeptide (TPR) repeat protein